MIKKLIATALTDTLNNFIKSPSKETFYALSKKDKDNLCQKYQEKFDDGYFLSDITRTTQLENAANALLTTCPTGRVFALGQSPAWIVYLASQFDDDPSRFGYIPFSGKWIRINSSGKFELAVNAPSEARIKCYQRNLEALGLSPKEILSRFKSNKEKTTIVDYVLSGCGLESFKQVYEDWLKAETINKEDFNNACQFIVLNERLYRTEYETVHNYPSVTISNDLLHYLTHDNEFSDRFVPSYLYSEWQETPPDIDAYNPENKPLIQFKILDDCLPPKE